MPRPHAAALIALAISIHAHADVIYVSAGASGADNGTSWANAYSGVQGLAHALAAARPDDEIWVAAGRYIPGTARSATFTLKNGVVIYGGFAGSESLLSQRDYVAHATVLSGDVNNNDVGYPSTTGWGENALHVVTCTGRNATAILDGVRISHGYANVVAPDQDRGGGIFSTSGNATFRNCTVIHNRATGGGPGGNGGGGAYFRGSDLTFTDCVFDSNQGGVVGGACAMATNSDPVFERCLIINNIANRGGGVDVTGTARPSFINCVFANNVCNGSGGGGAMCTVGAAADVINCTIYANSSLIVAGGGILAGGGTVRNSIAYLNTGPGGATADDQLNSHALTVTYSCVQGGFAGSGNISTNPILGAGDFRPLPGSPVIDAARSTDFTSLDLIDITHQPRMVDDPGTPDTGVGSPTYLDMGAVEFQPSGVVLCPELRAPPAGATICRNADFVLTVDAAGDVDGYQWRKSGIDIAGETSRQLAIHDAVNADEGDYTVVISSAGCKPIETDAAVVIVCMTDANCDHVINSTDVSDFINLWFADQTQGTLLADFDGNGTVNSTDVSDFINVWFAESANGCGG